MGGRGGREGGREGGKEGGRDGGRDDCYTYSNIGMLIDIHVNGVAKLLRGLNAHKATGTDAIPARPLKEAADQLAPILTTIYRASLQRATVPEEWKKANVVPIFKKGDHSAASNYRSVSLTSIASKVMEHIISSQVMRHLDINDVLHDAQHGFRKRRTCET